MQNKDWIEKSHRYTLIDGKNDFALNFAGMNFENNDIEELADKFQKVHLEMKKIENGEIKNPDENRKVTHFTDRTIYAGSELYKDVEIFAEKIRKGEITGSKGNKIESAVINGIGGSALGPQLIQFAVNGPYWNEFSENKRNGYLKIYFVDNTDSAGFADVLNTVELEKTIIINISKSGGTQETKNNLSAFSAEYKSKELDFAKHACAVTMAGSQLYKKASSEKWLNIFEMAESIGGRTSETSIVGHLPAALAGINFESFLRGACAMDDWTSESDFRRNPAYMLAAIWYIAGNGQGDKNMVIVPYSDRLILLSRYLQQLVMESLGKELDRDGNIVHQGLNVFGNKGGTDAHAFIQQLNDGRNDFFVTFLEVWKDAMTIEVEEGISMGDYLHGFQAGLSSALKKNNRECIQISISEINENNLGMIIALYERAVAAYAELININAFHQPGVQAYKLASKGLINLLKEVQQAIPKLKGKSGTAGEIANLLNMPEKEVDINGILTKIAVNTDKRDFENFTLNRVWNKDKGWIFSIE